VYKNFEDGSIAKKLKNPSKLVIKIALYNDDWTAVNPIGMYSRKHKICAFYFTILDLPRAFRSSQQGIWLVALCNSIAIKKFGIQATMKPIVSDLTKLESEGIYIAKLKTTVYVKLACVCADNLAGIFKMFLTPNLGNIYECAR